MQVTVAGTRSPSFYCAEPTSVILEGPGEASAAAGALDLFRVAHDGVDHIVAPIAAPPYPAANLGRRLIDIRGLPSLTDSLSTQVELLRSGQEAAPLDLKSSQLLLGIFGVMLAASNENMPYGVGPERSSHIELDAADSVVHTALSFQASALEFARYATQTRIAPKSSDNPFGQWYMRRHADNNVDAFQITTNGRRTRAMVRASGAVIL